MSPASGFVRNCHRSDKGGFEEMGNNILLAQADLGSCGAEAGISREARVGVRLKHEGASRFIDPEVDTRMPGQSEQRPGGKCDLAQLREQRLVVGCGRKYARRRRVGLAVRMPFLGITE